jgi:hypothetical protein
MSPVGSLLIELSTSLSNRILRKGDVFSIYVDVHNIGKDPINITDMRIVSPVGFISLSKDKKKPVWKRILGEFTERAVKIDFPGVFEIEWSPPRDQQGTSQLTAAPQSVTVASNDTYRENFIIQIGSRLGLRPRPDTYTISVEVLYTSGDMTTTTTYRKQLSIELSIFPTIGGMLGGTLLGSFLGTMTNNLQSINSIGLQLVPILLTNLALGFIVGVILMRKKDVQPFVTVEDFWGGILLGFLVGFGGQQLFEQFTGIRLGGNSTGIG